MTVPDREHPVRLDVGPCRCSDTDLHPDGDWVELRPKLSTSMGAAIIGVVTQLGADEVAVQSALADGLVRLGITDWSFTDGKENVPVSRETIDQYIGWTNGGYAVVEKAYELYLDDLFVPLAPRRPKLSPSGPMASSTPATPLSGSSRQKQPSRSSVVSTDTSKSAVPVP